ncbi:MAG: DUF1761 domain-containing protein [Hyphomicrobiaceae bacterium]|nr:DUF1761 domain-containing protein [Hyphomicrobiaceae bacterium]
MAFAGTNYLAIVLAAVVSYGFGALYYGALAKPWMAALGKAEEDMKASSIAPFVIAFVALLVMATVLAGVMGHLGPGQVTLRNGLISAGFVWMGFVATTLAVNNAFQGARPMLTVLDAGHWLGVLLIQGAIIGWMGV